MRPSTRAPAEQPALVVGVRSGRRQAAKPRDVSAPFRIRPGLAELDDEEKAGVDFVRGHRRTSPRRNASAFIGSPRRNATAAGPAAAPPALATKPDFGYPLPHSLRRREGGYSCAQ